MTVTAVNFTELVATPTTLNAPNRQRIRYGFILSVVIGSDIVSALINIVGAPCTVGFLFLLF